MVKILLATVKLCNLELGHLKLPTACDSNHFSLTVLFQTFWECKILLWSSQLQFEKNFEELRGFHPWNPRCTALNLHEKSVFLVALSQTLVACGTRELLEQIPGKTLGKWLKRLGINSFHHLRIIISIRFYWEVKNVHYVDIPSPSTPSSSSSPLDPSSSSTSSSSSSSPKRFTECFIECQNYHCCRCCWTVLTTNMHKLWLNLSCQVIL